MHWPQVKTGSPSSEAGASTDLKILAELYILKKSICKINEDVLIKQEHITQPCRVGKRQDNVRC